MKVLELLLSRARLILSIACLLALTGAISWIAMPRQEDPVLPYRGAIALALFPGANAETIERLVVEPVEERLAEVEEILTVNTTIRTGVAVFDLELLDEVYDVEEVWDEVRRKLDLAALDFPEGVASPTLDDETFDVDSIVVAVKGASDPLALADGAEKLKKALLRHPLVAKVNLIGDPDEQVTIELEDATARRLGIDPGYLANSLRARNLIVPGGQLRIGERSAVLDPRTDFASVEEIATTPILLPSGASVPLESIARVRRGPAEPLPELARINGESAVAVGIVPRKAIHLVRFGEQISELLEEERTRLAPLELETVFFQPSRVESRISDLGRSLAFGIMIVAGLLFFAMGVRLGAVVAAIIPLVAMTALGLFSMAGGVLHQMSIAALVIALGMLVDNAIVVAENVQYRIDGGARRIEAALAAVRELALPLGAATGTTLAAFVPMLVSQGATGDFTRAIPLLIMVTLTVSYLFAVLVTPVLSSMILRENRDAAGSRRLAELGAFIGRLAVRRSLPVLLIALALVGGSVMLAGFVDQRFFPSADRDQVVIDVELPEGSPISATEETSWRLESALLGHSEVLGTAAFIGRSAPHFYYNVTLVPRAPHLAQIVARTTSIGSVEEVMAFVRKEARRVAPEAQIVARRLEQGPPVTAPIEVRLFGDDLAGLQEAAEMVIAELADIEGTADLRHDMGVGIPHVRFEIDDDAAARRGLARSDVALALLGRTLGLPAGQYRAGDDPASILVRSRAGEEFPIEQLEGVDVTPPGGRPVPLAQVAESALEWRPAAIHHRNRVRTVSVLSQLEPGVTYSRVLNELEPRLAALTLPEGVTREYGGEAAESGKANAAIATGLPIGAALLLGFLLAEFNSFRRLVIVLATIPLAATGVVPGLLLAGQPFGFMSLLGVIALVGIVVNNAIVLIDVVERRRREGATIPAALEDGVRRRIRPILLTTFTTVVGLMPLALSNTSLWPPLAWAMISGLLASTLLTLAVVPALYAVLFPATPGRPFAFLRTLWRPAPAAATLLVAALALGTPQTRAAENPKVDFADALALASARPLVDASREEERAARMAARAERRAGFLPGVLASASALGRDRDLELDTPFGALPLGSGSFRSASVGLEQPLVDLRQWRYVAPAAEQRADAASESRERREKAAAVAAAFAYLDVLEIDAALASTNAFVESLAARLEETDSRVDAGRVLEADFLKIKVAYDVARQERRSLLNARRVATRALGRALGSDTSFEPDSKPTIEAGEALALSAAFERALESRADLAALRSSLRAAQLDARAVSAELWPTLDARASWQWDDSGQYTDESFVQGAITLTWRPFEAGTRAPRRAAAEARRKVIDAELQETLRGLRIEIEGALADLDTARGSLDVNASAIIDASETLRVEGVRYAEGRATTNDLLEAEALLRERRTAHDIAGLRVMRAWIAYGLALGEHPSAFLRM